MNNVLRAIMKKRRAQLKLSQGAAAARAGVDLKTWGRWERHDTIVRPENWIKIAKALDLQLDELQVAALAASQMELGMAPTATGFGKDLIAQGIYHFRYKPIAEMAEQLDLEINKTDQEEWLFPIGRWRTLLRRQLIAIEEQLFSAECQIALFRDSVLNLIGESAFRKIERRRRLQQLRVGKTRVTKKKEEPTEG